MATEATRNAINRDELLSQIKARNGWNVKLLAKEEEGSMGAMGIASSLAHVDGVCMDMGGGSIQVAWVQKQANGEIRTGPSVSFPYGAAALMSEISKSADSEQGHFATKIASKLRTAVEKDLQIPTSVWEVARSNGGFNVYLSGGGLRGWGHILMSRENLQPYPITIINGYSVTKAQFFSELQSVPADPSIFRISSRRASQVPAVQVLIDAIRQSQMPIARVTFAQGGVREGLLYSDLPQPIRAQHPLIASSIAYAPRSAPQLLSLLRDAIPNPIEPAILEATINLVYAHGSLTKDIRAAAALRCTTTGILAGAHGLSHHDRYMLALILCERWGGDISEGDAIFLAGLQRICGPLIWWTRYIGRVAKGIAEVFPAGLVREGEHAIAVGSGFPNGQDTSTADGCWVKIHVLREDVGHVVRAWAKDLEKLGKKKHWVAGESGMKVKVDVRLGP